MGESKKRKSMVRKRQREAARQQIIDNATKVDLTTVLDNQRHRRESSIGNCASAYHVSGSGSTELYIQLKKAPKTLEVSGGKSYTEVINGTYVKSTQAKNGRVFYQKQVKEEETDYFLYWDSTDEKWIFAVELDEKTSDAFAMIEDSVLYPSDSKETWYLRQQEDGSYFPERDFKIEKVQG